MDEILGDVIGYSRLCRRILGQYRSLLSSRYELTLVILF